MAVRTLLYVPILHTEADMGGLASVLSPRAKALAGGDRWARHLEVVRQFWQRVSEHLLSEDPEGLRIFQDGLGVEGEMGLRIVEEAARRGSANFRLLLDLVQRGALLQRTEDPALLAREMEDLLEALGSPGRASGEGDAGLRAGRRALLESRDAFIAAAVNGTLQEGETAVLFLGALHDVRPHLAGDLTVHEVKSLERVRAYYDALFSPCEGPWLQEASYLVAPVGHEGG